MKLSLTKSEMTANIVRNISSELKSRNWSLLRLSEESGVPYDTLKKLLTNRIENPNFRNIAKIAYALNVDINSLSGIAPITSVVPESTHSLKLIQYISELEKSLEVTAPFRKNDYIPVFVPLPSYEQIPFYGGGVAINYLAVGKYRERFGDKLSFGLRITGNSYHPVYFENDTLLVGTNRPPLVGEVGLFIKDGYAYIRRFKGGDGITLEPINSIGNSIILDSLDDWTIMGYVLGVYR